MSDEDDTLCDAEHHDYWHKVMIECRRPAGHLGDHQHWTQAQRVTWGRGGGTSSTEGSGNWTNEVYVCRHCGALEEWHWDTKRVDLEACFACNFWLRNSDPAAIDRAIVNGRSYFPCEGNGPGYGGRHVTIHYADGRTVESRNLWTQGEVPAHFRDRLPDNATIEWHRPRFDLSDIA